jgi:retron-type reverse transcriptase
MQALHLLALDPISETTADHASYGFRQAQLCRCNRAVSALERRLREVFPLREKGSTRGQSAQVHLIRYADDFIITGHSRELLEGTVKPLVESFLHERGLQLSHSLPVGPVTWTNAPNAVRNRPCPFCGHQRRLEPCELETLTHGS